MAIVQQIKVPLLSVNDTSLTVVDILFAYGAQVKIGETIIVFETSKTTYDVLAEQEGYIQYLCKTDSEYDVNFVVANIYAAANEVPDQLKTAVEIMPVAVSTTLIATPAKADWHGETLFSIAALQLMERLGLTQLAGGNSCVPRYGGKTLKTLFDGNATRRCPVAAAPTAVHRSPPRRGRRTTTTGENRRRIPFRGRVLTEITRYSRLRRDSSSAFSTL